MKLRLLLLGLCWAAACAPAVTTEAPTLPPPAVVQGSTAEPTPLASAVTPETLATATTAPVNPTAAPMTYNGIEQGLTADGFHYLGRADAPVTLTDYSDFL